MLPNDMYFHTILESMKVFPLFSFVSIAKAYPIRVNVTFRVKMAQSRWGNAEMFKTKLMDIMERYEDLPTDRLIFDLTFRGYVKTGFFTNTITVK